MRFSLSNLNLKFGSIVVVCINHIGYMLCMRIEMGQGKA